ASFIPFRFGAVEFLTKLFESGGVRRDGGVQHITLLDKSSPCYLERFDRLARLFLLLACLLNLSFSLACTLLEIRRLFSESGQFTSDSGPPLLKNCELRLESCEFATQIIVCNSKLVIVAASGLNLFFDLGFPGGDFSQSDFCLDHSLLDFGSFFDKPGNLGGRQPQTLMSPIEIRSQGTDTVIRVQHRLFGFLQLERETAFSCLAFSNKIFQADDLILRGDRFSHRQIHLRIQIANLSLQRKRTVILVFTPTHDVTANHFTRARDELEIRMLFRELPCAIRRVDDVCIANVLIEVMDSIIESNDRSQRQRAVDEC